MSMERILRKVAASRKSRRLLYAVSYVCVALSVAAYAYLLALAFEREKMQALYVLITAAVPFVAVSLLRRFIDAPRPYELYDFYEKKPKGKAGKSFPSRHVFSAALIGSLACAYSVPIGVCVLLLSVLLSVSRVLLGIHFIRDCVCGMLTGAVSAVIGIFIFGIGDKL